MTKEKNFIETSGYVDFLISSKEKIDIDSIIQKIGIFPSHSITKGEKISGISGNNSSISDFSWISYETSETIMRDISMHLEEIYQLFSEKTQKINTIKDENFLTIQICVVVYVRNGEMPVLNIPSYFVRFISQIGGEVSFDIYLYS